MCLHLRCVLALTFLTTRKNALTTIYDVSQSSEDLIKLNSLPSGLTPQNGTYPRHLGQKIFLRDKTIGLARLSERGSVQYTELLSNVDVEHEVSYAVDLSSEALELAASSANARADIGPRGLREFAQIDAHLIYDGTDGFLFQYNLFSYSRQSSFVGISRNARSQKRAKQRPSISS